jgi:carboxyl-terminal processing protease
MKMTTDLWRFFTFVGLGLLIALSAQQGLAEAGQKPQSERASEQGQTPDKNQKWEPSPERLEDLYHRVWQAIGDMYYSPEALANWGEWEHKYDGKLTREKELDKALEEMVSSLGDRWTRYTSKSEREGAAFRRHFERLVSSGMQLAREADGTYKIRSLVYGSPAQRSRLRVGDTVKYIDSRELKRLSPQEVSELLLAPVGTKVQVVYSDNGQDAAIELEFAPTLPAPVVAKLLNRTILYARLPDFRTEEILATLKRCITEIYQKAPNGIEGIVLDLRGNPGGEFDHGVTVAGYFLDKGVVATSTTRRGHIAIDQVHKVTPVLPHVRQGMSAEWLGLLDLLQRKPLIVLVDGSTMSAAELVAGALKDNGRALIVGTPTFGKAVGFRTFDLDNGGELTITGLKYLTPGGADVSQGGIEPHVVVQQRRSGQDVQLATAVQELSRLIEQARTSGGRRGHDTFLYAGILALAPRMPAHAERPGVFT